MCGIFGIIGKNYKKIENLFLEDLKHRGPDDDGTYLDNDKLLLLGHTRLSIIDISENGHQPMIDDTNNYVIVFNGEIYNFHEIKSELIKYGIKFRTNSDTEVVLKSYIKWGEDCVNKFRGMFAFCIHDKIKNLLFLSRDRLGIKPLIYTFQNGHFIFSSELKPLIKSGIINNKISPKAFSDIYKYGSVIQPYTIINNVFQLMPGHSMYVYFDLNYKIFRYYDLINSFIRSVKIKSYEEAIELVRFELETAIKYHMISDVDVGVFLSGGIDSTAVTALMSKHTNLKINTFSVGFINQVEVSDETSIASRTSKILGTNHHEILVDDQYIKSVFDHYIDSIDQPSIDGLNTYIVSKETSKNIKVALSGLGGDEIFAGYLHFKEIMLNSKHKNSIDELLYKLLTLNFRHNKLIYKRISPEQAVLEKRTFHHNLNYILSDQIKEYLSTKMIDSDQITKNIHEKYSDLSIIQRISLFEIDNYLLNTLLRDADVMSMAHSLELRPVLLDHHLVELVFGLSDEYKIKNGRLKSVLIESVKDIIPQEVWKRKKTGFSMPFNKWLNYTLNDDFKLKLYNSNLEDFYSKEYIKLLLYKINNRKLTLFEWIDFIIISWLKNNRFI